MKIKIVKLLIATALAVIAASGVAEIPRDWVWYYTDKTQPNAQGVVARPWSHCFDKRSLRREGDLLRVWILFGTMGGDSICSAADNVQAEYLIRCSDERLALTETAAGDRIDPAALKWDVARLSPVKQALVDKLCGSGTQR